MALKIVTPKDTDFPISLFTPQEDTEEKDDQPAWIPLACCSYGIYADTLDLLSETDIEA